MSPTPPPAVLTLSQTLTGQQPVRARDDGVWWLPTAPDAADALARELRGLHRETGWWPLLAHEPDVEEIWEIAVDNDLPVGAEAVAEISDEDIEKVLDADGDDLPSDVFPKPSVPAAFDQVGLVEWLGVLMVPAVQPWHALPFVGFGGFGSCPDPCEHGAAGRWLFEEHSSDPVAVGADTAFFRSLRPVAGPDLARSVRLLLSYCPALLDQEIDPDELAGLLQVGVKRLALWWD